jgi:hypothetical protein
MSDEAKKSQLEKWAEIAKDPDENVKRIRDRQMNQDQRIIPKRRSSIGSFRADAKEDELINALDDLAAIKRLAPTILKLTKKKITLEQAIRETSSDAFMMLMKLGFSEGSDKVKADVLKHLLALAGHSPAQKHQIERVDSNTPKEALLAMITGASSDLEKEGIEIEDDRDEEPVKDEGYET